LRAVYDAKSAPRQRREILIVPPPPPPPPQPPPPPPPAHVENNTRPADGVLPPGEI